MTVLGYMRNDRELINVDFYEKCEQIYVDTSKSEEYSQLNRLLRTIEKKDTVMVENLKVFELEIDKMKELIQTLQCEQIRLISLDDHIDTDNNNQFYATVLTLIQSNENVRRLKVKRRIARSRELGVQLGRPKIDMTLAQKISYYIHNEKLSMRATSELCQVSLGTVHKYSKMQNVNG